MKNSTRLEIDVESAFKDTIVWSVMKEDPKFFEKYVLVEPGKKTHENEIEVYSHSERKMFDAANLARMSPRRLLLDEHGTFEDPGNGSTLLALCFKDSVVERRGSSGVLVNHTAYARKATDKFET